jgi:hypothetical protein
MDYEKFDIQLAHSPTLVLQLSLFLQQRSVDSSTADLRSRIATPRSTNAVILLDRSERSGVDSDICKQHTYTFHIFAPKQGCLTSRAFQKQNTCVRHLLCDQWCG